MIRISFLDGGAGREFTPSDHTWVGAKIGLFANIVGDKEAGGYGDFEYLHVEALED